MPLTEKQMGDLFSKLHKKFREADDVDQSLREIENEKDFLRVLSRFYVKDGDTILGSYESLKVKQVQAVLNRAKELDISLAEILNARVFLLSFNSENKKRENISLYQCFLRNDFKFLPEVLKAIHESYKLESLWRDITLENCEKIKTKLDGDEHKDVLGKIDRIENIMAEEERSETSSLFSSDGSDLILINDDDMEDKNKPVSKAIVAGAICGVIAGLAVGGGLFAAGVALLILALIGIAVAAALVTGLVAGGITYVISSKIENPDTSRLEKEQDLQPN
ncbi:magnesium transporter [Wolbachia endosymbiont of Drosophila mauritiana]|uniref:SLC41A family transporter n=1 Tax=unclassified Wolbachia TaxID=2640676 RepID=UPI00107EB00B|nr:MULTISPECIES: magnesium transporter [unclassified Wolbachia]QCB62634.1 magnesium transporter [Wolbachia endosymbiont of Drosophila mauritiana]QCB63679.1 magnesium transporter [Wolbachia endosymbiont of Drosophila mauritiana]QWE33044.1 Uncharacterized protein WwMa_01000 [Wolbachia endosymbiont of Drosophila simulans]TGB05733.1 magnesium transporter [Wolbachia endosymbiont of Drosophila mauritiana]